MSVVDSGVCQEPEITNLVEDRPKMKWYEYPDTRVKITFRWGALDAETYDLWCVEEEKFHRMKDMGSLIDGLAAYGYDLFDVAWCNILKVTPSGDVKFYTRGSLVRSGERSMAVVMKPKKVVKKTLDDDKRAELEAVRQERMKTPELTEWELVERDRMGIDWLKCQPAEEAYEVDYAEKEEIDAWKIVTFMEGLSDREEAERKKPIRKTD